MANDKKQGPAADVNGGEQGNGQGNGNAGGNGQAQNRFRELFQSFTFQTATSGKTYPNSDGSVSRKIAAGVCIVRGGFVGAAFNVYARKGAGPKAKITADVSFVGTRGVQGIMPLDERAKQEFNDYKAFLATEYTKWRKGQGVVPTVASRTAAEMDEDIAAGIFDE